MPGALAWALVVVGCPHGHFFVRATVLAELAFLVLVIAGDTSATTIREL